MTPNAEPSLDALTLLSRCELFSEFDPRELDPSEVAALKTEIEMVGLNRGEALIRQGEPSDCMYAIVSGRFQVVVDSPDHGRNLVGELRAGETVGELGLIDGSPRMATVLASRDSKLVKISAAGFNRLVRCNAAALLKIARAEAVRMRNMGQQRYPVATVRTVAIIGSVAPDVLSRFVEAFCEALGESGSVLYLTRSRFEALFDPAADAIVGGINALEADHRFVVCQGDPEPSAWTMDSVRQADRILSVHDAAGSPELSATERAIFAEQNTGRMPPMELVLLHGHGGTVFPGTPGWLMRREVVRHHHVRSGSASDAGRVARLLSGRAIGLALGGGGARGFAHIGVMRAIEEAGIPVDMVGGVSMGSIVSALYAMGHDWQEIIQLAKRQMTRKLTSGITLPLVALSTGRRFRRALETFFGEHTIEDLGLNYFCSSCNLSTGEIMVHRAGLLLNAVYASNAIPVLLPPMVAGGHMLIDGGVLNNQPGDLLKRLCGGSVIVSNVSPKRDMTVDTSLLEMPSPWRILWSRINPFERTIQVPGISATMVRTLMVASDRKSKDVEHMADFYLRPPVAGFRLDDYDRIEEIAEAGYQHAREEIRGWKESGRYPVPPER